MKRLLILLLIFAMILGATACNGSKPAITPSKPTDETNTTQTPDQTGESSEKPVTDESTSPVTAANSVSLDEQLLVDQEGVAITLTGLDFSDDYYAGKIKVLIENDSDKNINVGIWAIAINDIMIKGDLYANVESGKKLNETITFDKGDFADAGIEVIKTIDVIFDVFDSGTYEDIFVTELISLTTDGSEDYVQVYFAGDQLVFDQDGIKLVVRDFVEYEHEHYGAGVNYYVENNSENHVYITAGETSINGFMVEGGLYVKMLAGAKAYTSMDFVAEELVENDIYVITEVETSYSVYNPDTYENYFIIDNVKTNF